MTKQLLRTNLEKNLRKHFGPGVLGDNVDIGDMLHQLGDGVSALLYSQLFVPSLIEVDGSVLLNFYPDSDLGKRFIEKKREAKLSLTDLEASFNLIEIPYLFSNRKSSGEEDALLANLLAEAWRGRLAYIYSTRMFVVQVLPASADADIAIQFFEERKSRYINKQ